MLNSKDATQRVLNVDILIKNITLKIVLLYCYIHTQYRYNNKHAKPNFGGKQGFKEKDMFLLVFIQELSVTHIPNLLQIFMF
jgi:hypothetical protein